MDFRLRVVLDRREGVVGSDFGVLSSECARLQDPLTDDPGGELAGQEIMSLSLLSEWSKE